MIATGLHAVLGIFGRDEDDRHIRARLSDHPMVVEAKALLDADTESLRQRSRPATQDWGKLLTPLRASEVRKPKPRVTPGVKGSEKEKEKEKEKKKKRKQKRRIEL
jgi:hypothetical protein